MEKTRKKLLLITGIVISCIYITWRIFFTLPVHSGTVSMICGLILLFAEIMGFFEAVNSFICATRTYEPERPEIKEDYPDVDVFVATYNEPEELLEKTILGCLNMDYPDKRKVHIYICDDGSRSNIKQLAKRMNVSYIEREEHTDAKAGNYNHALVCTSSPLIATFDADMIPMHDFLTAIVPYFYLPYYDKDEYGVWRKRKEPKEGFKIGYIQSPQSFYNYDLYQYNLYSEDMVPNEQDFFFRQVQLNRNGNNSAIYGGSNTIISRQALQDVGGFYTKSITEDLATGLLIQSKGYKGYEIADIHASGLSPTELDSLFKQRERWARGCIQTCRRLHILRLKGLTWGQKFSYLFSTLYWYAPLRRGVYTLAPILFSVFNITLLECTIAELLIFWLPQILIYNRIMKYVCGDIRTARLSNIYDTVVFPYISKVVLLETFGISKNKFVVTNKDKNQVKENETKRFARKYYYIFGGLIVLSAMGIISCIYHTIAFNTVAYLIILYWLCVNGYNLIMAFLFVHGRKMYYETDRVKAKENVVISCNNKTFETVSCDISEGGVCVYSEEPYYFSKEDKIHLSIMSKYERYQSEIDAKIVNVKKHQEGYKYSFQFLEVEEENKQQLYGILYDRVPPMPRVVNEQSCFYQDIRNNILSHIRKDTFSQEILPVINCNTVCETDSNSSVTIKRFCYEYILVKEINEKECVNIYLNQEKTLKLQCVKVKNENSISKELCRYDITNYEDIITCSELEYQIKQWIQEENKRLKLAIKQQKSKGKGRGSDEFDEISYVCARN